jgi:hypothetical protein
MIIGLLQIYNEVNWVGYSIDHAMKFCDKLIIIEGSQFKKLKKVPERSFDGTLEIIYKKMKDYSDSIELINTIRKFSNYRENQAANFNLVLSKCKIGDYLAPLDADQFYFDNYIKRIKEVAEEGKIDYLMSSGIILAFSFKWRIIFNNVNIHSFQTLFKKNNRLKFIPTHRPINNGPIKVYDDDGKSLIHYMWIRPNDRILLRLKTARNGKKRSKWYKNYWDKIELVENKMYKYLDGYFYLKQYNGAHPEILRNHPWRNIEDIRKL